MVLTTNKTYENVHVGLRKVAVLSRAMIALL